MVTIPKSGLSILTIVIVIVQVSSVAYAAPPKAYEYREGKLNTVRYEEGGKYYRLEFQYDANGNNKGRVRKQVNRVDAPAQPYLGDFSYEVVVYGIGANASRVQFPTWTDRNGQDDIRWYEGVKLTTGIWKAVIPYSNHNNETGTYFTHVYADNSFVDGTGVIVQSNAVSVQTPAEVNLADGSYEITVKGVGGNINHVFFPTWTLSNGQDDLQNPWISGRKVAPGEWKVTVCFDNHMFEPGVYVTHIYGFDQNGNSTLLGTASTNAVLGVKSPSSIDISNASYEIYVFGIDSSATNVQFPTWSNLNGQDDLRWYDGTKVSNRMWKARIPFSNHEDLGYYTTHVYANGAFIAASISNVTGNTTIQAPSQTSRANGFYDVLVYGVGDNAVSVLFPTWTASNGQDDIEWIQGQKIAPGKWKATIQFNKHNNESGAYITHVYSYDQYGNGIGIGGTTVGVQ